MSFQVLAIMQVVNMLRGRELQYVLDDSEAGGGAGDARARGPHGAARQGIRRKPGGVILSWVFIMETNFDLHPISVAEIKLCD